MKFYAVKNGHKIGIFNTWEDCKAQVYKYPNAVYKSFDKYEDAYNYFHDKVPIQHTYDSEYIEIFTDGSLFYINKQVCCGYGIYIPVLNLKLYKKLDCGKITNNRAELKAIIEAIEICKDYYKIKVYTDSKYSILVLGETGQRYKSQQFKNSKNNYVPNHDLIEHGLKVIENKNIIFHKVISHSGKSDFIHINNDIADTLAIKGAISGYCEKYSLAEHEISFGNYKHQKIKNIDKSYYEWATADDNFQNRLCINERLKILYYILDKYFQIID